MKLSELNIKNVFFSYNSTPTLKNISFNVGSGEFIGIVGPNGSGKTTLLRCIARTLELDKGQILINNRDIKKISTRDLAKQIAVVPQGGTIEFDFSVRDIVLMGRHPHQGRFTFETKEDFFIVEKCLKITHTRDFKNKSIQKLSGGEFQRVIIARALAQQPKVLLLDEPTTHLDISHQLEIMDIMAQLNDKKKITILGVFHDLNLAARYCKRLLIMHRGKLVDDGPLEKVLTPANLNRVFKINSIVRRNPITNNLFIDPIGKVSMNTDIESHQKITPIGKDTSGTREKSKSDFRTMNIHIICGAGTGSALMRQLSDEGLNLSTGVLNVLDQDHQSAEELNIPVVSEAAFSPISAKSHKMNLGMISNADILVLTHVPFGPANQRNLEAMEFARRGGKNIIFYEPEGIKNIERRDFTNGRASKRYVKIKDYAKVFHSINNIIKYLHDL